MFPIYPYINVNDLNLDYLLKSIKEIQTQVEYFVSLNAIKYADPIQWNITRQYEKNTIVIDPQTGTAYISVAPVPIGAQLTRPEYWTVVFDLGSFVVRASKNFAINYEADTTTTATFNTPKGGWLVWGDVLYIANVPITAGDSYVDGGNISHFTMEEIIGHLSDLSTTNKDSIVDAINELYLALNNAVNALSLIIGDLNDLTTTDKTSVVNAINSLQSDITNLINVTIGDLNDLTTSDKTSVVNAINSLVTDLGNVSNDLTTLSNKVGDLNDLITTDKDTIVDAINEVKGDFNAEDSKVGDLADLTTTDKSSIVNAINDITSVIPQNIINVLDYGAVGDGVTDDLAAINLAITDAESTGKPLYFPSNHTYYVSNSVTFSTVMNYDVYMDGDILYNGSNAAINISGRAIRRKLRLRAISNNQHNPVAGSVGVHIDSAVSSEINIANINGFETGLSLRTTTSGNQIGQNTFTFGYINNNKYGISIDAYNSWINDNLFINPYIRTDGANVYHGANTGILITGTASSPNDNIFIKPCIEDALYSFDIERGFNNKASKCRFESSTYGAKFNESNTYNNSVGYLYEPSIEALYDNVDSDNGTRSNMVYNEALPNYTMLFDSGALCDSITSNSTEAVSNNSLILGLYRDASYNPVYGRAYKLVRGKYAVDLSNDATIIGCLINTSICKTFAIVAHGTGENSTRYRGVAKLYDSSNNEITTGAAGTIANRVTVDNIDIFRGYALQEGKSSVIHVPDNCDHMFLGIKGNPTTNGIYSFQIFGLIEGRTGTASMAGAYSINSPIGLDSIPTCNAKRGDYCINTDTSDNTLKGWYYDGSTWQPDYINSTP